MAMQLQAALTILRCKQVQFRTGSSRSTLYANIAKGLFVAPISIGARAVGWPSSDVDSMIGARIEGKSDDEIRALVLKLEAARKSAI